MSERGREGLERERERAERPTGEGRRDGRAAGGGTREREAKRRASDVGAN